MIHAGLAGDTRTPGAAGGLFNSTSAALTPLCFDMGSLQLSATPASQLATDLTPASNYEDNDADTPFPAKQFSLTEGVSSAGETPAFPKARAGWKQSMFDAAGGESCNASAHHAALNKACCSDVRKASLACPMRHHSSLSQLGQLGTAPHQGN